MDENAGMIGAGLAGSVGGFAMGKSAMLEVADEMHKESLALRRKPDFIKSYAMFKKKFPKASHKELMDMATAEEKSIATFTDSNGKEIGHTVSDDRKNNDLNAILSIVRTIFISVVLAGAAYLFGRDIEEYVLTPIEKML